MKSTSYTIVIIVVGLALIYNFGVYIGGLLSLLCGVLGYVIVMRIEKEIEERKYMSMWEDIFVVSRHPKTGEQIDLGDDLDRFVVWVNYEDVFIEVCRIEGILRKIGNDAFCNPTYTDDELSKVHGVIFQSGEHINEDWGYKFRARLKNMIMDSREKNHKILKERDAEWYAYFGDNQKGVTWQKQ